MIINREVTIKALPIKDSFLERNENLVDKNGKQIHFNIDRKCRITPKVSSNGYQIKAFDTEEERILLPEIISISANDPKFSKAADIFWKSVLIEFSLYKGLTLNTSIRLFSDGRKIEVTNNNKIEQVGITDHTFKVYCKRPEDEYIWGYPVVSGDYWKWRFCLRTSQVANSYAIFQQKRGKNMEFYIYDKDEEKRAIMVATNAKVEAMEYYMKAKDSKDLIEGILRVYEKGRSYKKDKLLGRSFIFDELAEHEKDSILQEILEKYPQDFIDICKDTKLVHKSFIRKCVANGVITNPIGSTFYKYGEEILGGTLEEVMNGIDKNPGLRKELEFKVDQAERIAIAKKAKKTDSEQVVNKVQ